MPEPTWRKSSHSNANGGACVEVANLPSTTTPGAALAVRDSKHPTHPHLTFQAVDWQTFVHAVRTDAL